MNLDDGEDESPQIVRLSADSDSEESSQSSTILHDKTSLKDKPDKSSSLPILTVMGLYGRAPMPGADLLPEDHTEKDLKSNQFMCRRRLKTKPLRLFTNSHNDNSTNNNVKNNEEDGYDIARFVKIQGLVDSTFWHISINSKAGLFEDRAILFQAIEHYDAIAKESRFSSCFNDYLNSPYFGEQVIVKGLDSSQLAVGDVFEVEDNLSSLVVEITSPRKPCYFVNKRNGTPNGSKGMLRHTLSTGQAGWFTKVLVAGELCDGMRLVRTKHPNPKWTLAYLSKVLYAEGSKTALLACRAEWSRETEELEELVNLKQLGEYEWKMNARDLLEKRLKQKESSTSILSYVWSLNDSTTENLKLSVKGLYGRPWENNVDPKTKFGKMVRERYLMSPVGEKNEGEDAVAFGPTRGMAYEEFWHVSDEEISNGNVHSDRAILFQSVEHYETLANDQHFASCFDNGKYDYMTVPTFGEQVIVEGCDSTQICVGDVFKVEGGLSTLVIEVTSPRKPGDNVDLNHHCQLMGFNGIKMHCLIYGLGGWFVRVLAEGKLRDGMVLVRTKHPNPKWDLAFISHMMYSKGDVPEWRGEKEELIEMINLPQLGEVDWREEGVKLLQSEKFVHEEAEPEPQGYFSQLLNFATGASSYYCDGIESLLVCATGSGQYD